MDNNTLLYDDKYCLFMMKEGDEEFFNLLYKKYRNKLYTFLLRITKSKETAEEIVLDVFLKIWQGREAAHEIEDLEAFLYRVAYHKAIDFFRAAKRNPAVQQDIWENLSQFAASGNRAEEMLVEKELETALHTAISLLPRQRKKVFYLREYEGLSYKDIASKLQLSNHTVRNHLASSVQFIREFLLKNDLAGLLILVFSRIFF